MQDNVVTNEETAGEQVESVKDRQFDARTYTFIEEVEINVAKIEDFRRAHKQIQECDKEGG